MLTLDRALDLTSDTSVDGRLEAVNPLLPIVTRRLRLELGGVRLIDDLDLHLGPSALTVLMGQNGAGKSLLLRLLHGLLTPTSGDILFAGRSLDDRLRLDQALVFQRPVLLRRSVAANVDFVLGLRGKATVERRTALLQRVGLGDKAGQPARLLSGGEQQRLALARVLALEPKVLFLDEPTASLDPASTMMIEAIVRSLHQGGTKVIFITHDLGQARRLADEILFLHQGRVEEHASASAFFEQPKSEIAASFLEGRIIV